MAFRYGVLGSHAAIFTEAALPPAASGAGAAGFASRIAQKADTLCVPDMRRIFTGLLSRLTDSGSASTAAADRATAPSSSADAATLSKTPLFGVRLGGMGSFHHLTRSSQ